MPPTEDFLLPDIYPDDAEHREHMSSWCDGTALAEAGGVGPNPKFMGSIHMLHMASYCRARAIAHSTLDDIFAGPVGTFMVFGSPVLAVVLCCIIIYVLVGCCKRRRAANMV